MLRLSIVPRDTCHWPGACRSRSCAPVREPRFYLLRYSERPLAGNPFGPVVQGHLGRINSRLDVTGAFRFRKTLDNLPLQRGNELRRASREAILHAVGRHRRDSRQNANAIFWNRRNARRHVMAFRRSAELSRLPHIADERAPFLRFPIRGGKRIPDDSRQSEQARPARRKSP